MDEIGIEKKELEKKELELKGIGIDQMEFNAALIIYKMKWPETMCSLCHTVIHTVRPFSR